MYLSCVFRLTRLQYIDAQQVGGAIGHCAPGAIVIPPIKQGSALICSSLLTSGSGDAEAKVGVSGRTIHCSTRAKAQQLIAPLQSAVTSERHQIQKLSVALCWLKAPCDCSGNAGIVPWLYNALQVKRVSVCHTGRAGGCRNEEDRFCQENKTEKGLMVEIVVSAPLVRNSKY